jgi:hypothetical protein
VQSAHPIVCAWCRGMRARIARPKDSLSTASHRRGRAGISESVGVARLRLLILLVQRPAAALGLPALALGEERRYELVHFCV